MKPIIPDAALQQHIAVLGKNGSGKTYATKAVIVEPLLAAGKHVVLVDPTGAWWGLRSSADGKGPGFSVLVLGGDHGDMPLPANGGAAVARLVIEQRVNAVIDTGSLSVGERTRWMIDFAGAIYRLNRTPLYLVLDEAHVFAPQGGGGRSDVDANKMLHAVNQLASGGRSRGIRLTMITQRPQKLHKDSLTTADTLIAMRVLAPHDREAVKAWIDGCGDAAQGKQVLDSLAQLKRGEGWVWYPEGGHLIRTKFPAIKTFDSSATPTEGSALKAPKGAAEIDLTEIRAALADAVKDAEANDPKLLRAALAAAQVEIAKLSKSKVSAAPAAGAAELAAEYTRGRAEGFDAGRLKGRAECGPYIERAHQALASIIGTAGHADGFLRDMKLGAIAEPPPATVGQSTVKRPTGRATVASAPRAAAAPVEGVSGPQQRILDALAWCEAVGLPDADRTQLALLAKASPTSSSYSNNLGALRNALGLVEYLNGQRIRLTAAGRATARAPEAMPTTEDLHRFLERELPGPQWRIVAQLITAYPDAIDKTTLADQVEASVSSSSFSNNLGALRTLGLIDYPKPGDVVALPVLFLER